jgi:DNA-damage-inducible protein D
MKKEIIQKLHTSFEEAAQMQDGVEFWFARDLQVLLGYDEWRNFTKVVEKSKEACKNAGVNAEDQFVDVNKLIVHGKGGKRQVTDIMLTRYACYLIAQNGDPSKEPIAFAQTYFAVQTRKQELIEERLQPIERLQAREKLETTETELSRLIYERGVDNQGFRAYEAKATTALTATLMC